ncbi:hypothetical protein, partial [Corallococcus sp. 4LFB]|uniref:hypothetical protein n=1 Tax=Corallococcus sp. 4LFB TaxID=3383249 RepID=UPI0039751FD4
MRRDKSNDTSAKPASTTRKSPSWSASSTSASVDVTRKGPAWRNRGRVCPASWAAACTDCTKRSGAPGPPAGADTPG